MDCPLSSTVGLVLGNRSTGRFARRGRPPECVLLFSVPPSGTCLTLDSDSICWGEGYDRTDDLLRWVTLREVKEEKEGGGTTG